MDVESDSTAEQVRQKNPGRARVYALAAAIVLLAGLWTGGWYWGAAELDARFAAFSAELARRGGTLSCQNREVRGYPFRIGVFCDRFAFGEPRGSSVDAGALRTAAQLYAPGRIVGELEGPVEITTPARQRYGLTFATAILSGRVGLGGPQSASLALANPALLAGGADGAAAGEAKEVQIHVRRNPDQPADLDLAATGQSVKLAQADLPVFTLSGDLAFTGLADAIEPGFSLVDHAKENGLAGTIRSLSVVPEAGGRMELSGDFRAGPDGLLDGDFAVAAENFPALAIFLAGLFPENADEIRAAAGLLAGFSQPEAGKEGKGNRLRLAVSRGRIQLGFLKIGEIAPLW